MSPGWLQTLIGALAGVALGAVLSFLVQRKVLSDERRHREDLDLLNAVRGILGEIEFHLNLSHVDPKGMRPVFPSGMWEIHKQKIPRLPLETQEKLQKAYCQVAGINATVWTTLAHASKNDIGYGEGIY